MADKVSIFIDGGYLFRAFKQHYKVVSNAFFVRCPSWHLQQACNGKKIVLDEVDFIYKKDNPKDLFTLKEHFQKK